MFSAGVRGQLWTLSRSGLLPHVPPHLACYGLRSTEPHGLPWSVPPVNLDPDGATFWQRGGASTIVAAAAEWAPRKGLPVPKAVRACAPWPVSARAHGFFCALRARPPAWRGRSAHCGRVCRARSQLHISSQHPEPASASPLACGSRRGLLPRPQGSLSHLHDPWRVVQGTLQPWSLWQPDSSSSGDGDLKSAGGGCAHSWQKVALFCAAGETWVRVCAAGHQACPLGDWAYPGGRGLQHTPERFCAPKCLLWGDDLCGSAGSGEGLRGP